MRRTGFTLTELLVVVIIVGILAALAMPNYQRTIERGYWREAQDLLLTIYAGERAYSFVDPDEKYFGPLSPASPITDWRKIHTDNPNLAQIDVDFSVAVNNAPNPRQFAATAKRIGGPCNNSTISINENRVFTPNPATTRCWCGSC